MFFGSKDIEESGKMNELEKIKFYFEEGAKLWKKNPEKVLSREFYELWEEIQEPQPFLLEGESFSIMGQSLQLPERDFEIVGSFEWNFDEDCACLSLGGNSWTQKILLSFEDGAPQISDLEPQDADASDISYGEQLDLVFDVIMDSRKRFPLREIPEMTKKEFIEALEWVAERHDKKLLAQMKRSSAHFIKNLLKRAMEDMAADELSDQLSLGLDGTFSTQNDMDPTETIEHLRSGATSIAELQILPRTKWRIKSDLAFLAMAAHESSEAEKDFILFFDDAKILGVQGSEAAISFKTSPDMPICEGDILNVFERGFQERAGTFRVDVFEGNCALGRLRMDAIDPERLLSRRLYMKSAPSSRPLIAASLETMGKDFSSGKLAKDGSALDSALGIAPSRHRASKDSAGNSLTDGFDHSQKSAFAAACDMLNPLVIVQGPPGTGKTRVLEAVLEFLCRKGQRILATAPSNTAVDNICRRLKDLPILRFGSYANSIAPDVMEKYWIGDNKNIDKFSNGRTLLNGGGIYAGTQVGLLKNSLIEKDAGQNGLFDAVVFDEAGMSRIDEFLLCAKFAKRAILFGDHQQLPPFPLPQETMRRISEKHGVMDKRLRSLLSVSAIEWLAVERKIPVIMLRKSYRCQNPRLLRFASTLFYDAAVKTSEQAEYFKLPFAERQKKYPQSTVRLYSTSSLPQQKKCETIFLEGNKPGIENPCEAEICVKLIYEGLSKYELNQITVITPYRLQAKLIRKMLDKETAKSLRPEMSDSDWDLFLQNRISTVDSFQGNESDFVIISYVRSNEGRGTGFVGDPNRINVAHTRCRKEMAIVGDIECLKQQSGGEIFRRMERAVRRDGEIIELADLLDFMLKRQHL